MKLMKRVTALFLCFLMLSAGPLNAFATDVSGNDVVVVETTAPTGTVASCEECGGSDAHTDTCSFNTINTLNTEAPAETTQPTTAPTETTGETVSGNDVGCTECGETEGHLDTCSQYVAPVEPTTEPTTAPANCEHCGVALVEGAVHEATCLTNCTCEPVEGVHQGECVFAPVVETCEHCGAELTEETVHTEECPLYEAPVVINVFADLMAAESVEAMYAQILNIVNGDDADRREALMNLTYDELEELRARVNQLDPEGDDTDTTDMLDMLSALPNAECPDCGLVGEHEEDCPRYQVETLLPNDGYIYFDLYYGDVKITDTTYSGWVWNGTSTEAVTGTHTNDNRYYIYQSNPSGGKQGVCENGAVTLPVYDPVKIGGISWGEYITNHPNGSTTQTHSSATDTSDSVNTVINAWGSCEDDSYTANTDGINNTNSVTNGAAIEAKRKPTNYRITVQGITNTTHTFDVTIDNIWSIFQEKRNSYSIYGGFAFNTYYQNKTLKLTFRGDNRFGNMHMATLGDSGINLGINSTNSGSYGVDPDGTNKAEFHGWDANSTLTVANVSAGKSWQGTNSAIGGSDMNDYSVRMKFCSGIVYAGTTPEDFATAIGGGGNGDGNVEITDTAIVTAVNNSTGTAIGGGCGTSGHGGYGNVTISGGEVYAYSYALKNIGFVPGYTQALPTAIGGGSSGTQVGGTGIVDISGNAKVYAYSEVGNAIGGGGGGKGYLNGNNYNTYGGTADVRISGTAVVDAISGTGCAIGGGPGGGVLYKDHLVSGQLPTATDGMGILNQRVVCDGGTAKLTISGNPIIRSGSIGGGSPLPENRNYGASVGAAVVNISGGTTHGQIVMDGEIKNAPSGMGLTNGASSSFTMTDGLIDNTFIDAKYRFVEENGGAVYINSGSAKMSGGEIRDASSPLGGAIYLQGGNFELSGTALIQDCSATELGGAVYVKGGNATVSGGTIQRCHAPSGGAVYVTADDVTGGNFTMSGGTIGSATEADTNTADNGAGVYVNGGQFTMSGGKMIGNKATENGGAAYVTGGDFTMSGGTIGGEAIGEANTAINGAGVYVSGSATTGKFEMSGGSITANKATTHGGAAYVSGGSITMTGGTINKNTAINGAGAYVTGGEFDMISGSLTNNVATSHGGGAYVHGGSITIGVENCKAEGENHDVTYTDLTHPLVLDNDASFGGGLAADGGEINIYCGKIITNTADNAGMGDNIFMYDQNTTDDDKPVLNHINGTVGADENHGMVVIGGDMNIPYEEGQLKITINYHDNGKDLTFEVWVGEAPEEYFLNLPYCPQNWETTQNGNGFTFVGWTYDTKTTAPPVQDDVDLSFIRDKEDYKALGDPVKIRKVDWKEKDGGYYIDFYAVWAPLKNYVTYDIDLNNYGSVQDELGKAMTDAQKDGNTTSYAFSQTVPATITMTNPEITGYTFKGWRITPSEDKISNWSVKSNAVDEAVTYPVDGTTSGTASLAGYSYKYENGQFILTTDRNFGDIKLTAVFEEQTAEYTYILVGPEKATNFGTMTAQDASESYTDVTENKQYIVKIGKVTGNPGTATAEAAYGFKLKDPNGWFTNEAGTATVTSNAATVADGTLTPVRVNGLYEGGTFYAVIEYHLADLIISKTATGSFSDDQTFIFEVYQGDKLLTTVALRSGESVTIKDLTIGTTYTVKEVGGWSWRFDVKDATHEMLPVTEGAKNPNKVEFANTQLKDLWLTDDAFVLNKRKGSN